MRSLRAGLAYFAATFGVGFVLGMVRVPVLVPRLGERMAELVESPVMLVAMVWIARWVVRRFEVPPAFGARAAVGGIALGLMLAAEALVVLAVRREGLGEHAAGRDPVAGGVYLGLLLLFGALPWLLAWVEPRAGDGEGTPGAQRPPP